jgi:F-type H+-transporting ATPase subunit gamma
MASLKEIKQHIVAVRQTQKLTKAMNMVAAAKLRSTQNKAEAYQEYADEVGRLLSEIGKRSSVLAEGMYPPAKDSDKALFVVFTSDRGLCGSYNTSVLQKTDRAVLDAKARGLTPVLLLVGRKGRDYYRRRQVETLELKMAPGPEAPSLEPEYLKPSLKFVQARALTDYLVLRFADLYKEINLIYTSFETLNRHPVQILPLLPLAKAQPDAPAPAAAAPAAEPGEPEGSGKAVVANLDYSIEPDPEDLLKSLIPNSLAIEIYRASLESETSENAARMQAMDNATKSCVDIIQSLTLAFNKARQAAVTNELLDIVNGAEALKG